MDRRHVGIDLHRRRSVIYAMDAEGDITLARYSDRGLVWHPKTKTARSMARRVLRRSPTNQLL
jgi:hypothetical protein